jgi:hypothetical protein
LFDFIVFKRTGNQKTVDLGLLAETLLFYQRVHIVFDPSNLGEFVRSIGLGLLIELLNREGVSASFQRNITGVITNTSGGMVLHNYAIFKVTGDKTKKTLNDREYIESIIKRELGTSYETTKLFPKFRQRISFSPLPEDIGGNDDIIGAAETDLHDESFLRASIESTLLNIVPGLKLPQGWIFRPHFVGPTHGGRRQFAIEANFDLSKAIADYPAHAFLTPAYLIAFVLTFREAAYIASKHMSELLIDPPTSSVMKIKCLELMKKRDRQCTELDLFQDMIFQNGRAIREVINSGEKSFAEFLRLLDKASKFKKFLALQNAELGLLESYYSDLRTESWVDKLPSKATRIVLANGLGAAAEALFPTGGISSLIGLGYSAIDGLMLDKLLKGWRPNQFIDDHLVPFVNRR